MSYDKPTTPDEVGDSNEILKALRGEWIEPRGEPAYNLDVNVVIDRAELGRYVSSDIDDGILASSLERYVRNYAKVGGIIGGQLLNGRGKYHVTDDGFILPGHKPGIEKKLAVLTVDDNTISSISSMSFAMENGLGNRNNPTTLVMSIDGEVENIRTTGYYVYVESNYEKFLSSEKDRRKAEVKADEERHARASEATMAVEPEDL